ncbi:hypothetical protein ABIB81_005406 [Bradyrhizobium sp. I1.7.5]
MQIQSKALPQSFSLRRSFRSFTAPEQGGGTYHPLLVVSVVVLLTLFRSWRSTSTAPSFRRSACSAMGPGSIPSS